MTEHEAYLHSLTCPWLTYSMVKKLKQHPSRWEERLQVKGQYIPCPRCNTQLQRHIGWRHVSELHSGVGDWLYYATPQRIRLCSRCFSILLLYPALGGGTHIRVLELACQEFRL